MEFAIVESGEALAPMKTVYCILVILSVLSATAHAQHVVGDSFSTNMPNVTTPLALRSTSNTVMGRDYLHRERSIGFTNATDWKNLQYAGDLSEVEERAPWVQFTGYKFLGSLDFRATKRLSLSTSVGVGNLTLDEFLDQRYDTSETVPLWKVRANYELLPKTMLKLEANSDYYYGGWLNEANRSQILTVQNYSADIESNFFEKWQIRASVRNTYFKDSNRQIAFDQQILREVFSGPFVLKAGFGGGVTGFHEQTPSYWSPTFAEVYGMRFAASKNFGKFVLGEVRLNACRDPSAEMNLQYNYKKDWRVKVTSNLASTDGRSWRGSDVGIRAEIPLRL